jgi:signal transduction histidine kinase
MFLFALLRHVMVPPVVQARPIVYRCLSRMRNSSRRGLETGRGLVFRFAAASLVAFVPIGAALTLMISRQVVGQAQGDARRHADFVANSILRTEINGNDLTFLVPMQGARFSEFQQFVQARILQAPVVLVRIWRSDGVVVFSSVHEQIGSQHQPLVPGVRQAFHDSATVSSVGARDSEDAAIEELPSKLVKTYVPVFLGQDQHSGIPLAVVEVYTDYGIVQGQVDRVFRILVATLAAGLLALYLFLLPIARRVSRKLENQAVRLQEHLRAEQSLQAERRGLLERTLRAAEDERTRIAAELHDGPVQRVAQLAYGMERVRLRLDRGDLSGAQEVLERIQTAAFEEVQELRGMMSQLRPPVLDQRGLEEALRDRAAAVERDHQVECEVHAELDDRLASDLETVLYRVSQEALTNVVKHAGAKHVALSLHRENGSVALEIKDDGVGFDPGHTAGDGGSHFGLLAMRERVEISGGSWELESRPGRGTRIRAVLPLEVKA